MFPPIFGRKLPVVKARVPKQNCHVGSMEKGPAPASSSTTPGVSKGQLSGLISGYKTKTDDGAFASFLLEFEGLLK